MCQFGWLCRNIERILIYCNTCIFIKRKCISSNERIHLSYICYYIVHHHFTFHHYLRYIKLLPNKSTNTVIPQFKFHHFFVILSKIYRLYFLIICITSNWPEMRIKAYNSHTNFNLLLRCWLKTELFINLATLLFIIGYCWHWIFWPAIDTQSSVHILFFKLCQQKCFSILLIFCIFILLS